MRKIPTLFVRDPEDRRYVTREVTPGCEWVLAGEGVATRKYDGTCVMFDGVRWWARREVRSGKEPPPQYVAVSTDEVTGKTVGWEPIERSSYYRWFREAESGERERARPGTYELCGPKVNGNPEGFEAHTLVEHATAQRLILLQSDVDYLFDWMRICPQEGVVWHHPDGRRVKLKRRDFPSGRE